MCPTNCGESKSSTFCFPNQLASTMNFFFICAIVFLGLMAELHASQPSFFRQTAHQRGLIAQKSVPFSKVGRVDYSLIDRSLLNKEKYSPASALSQRKLQQFPANQDFVRISLTQRFETIATAEMFESNNIAVSNFKSTIATLLGVDPALVVIKGVVDDSASPVKQSARLEGKGTFVKNEMQVSYTVEYPYNQPTSVIVGLWGHPPGQTQSKSDFPGELEASLQAIPGFSDLIALPPTAPTVADAVIVDANGNPIAQPTPPNSPISADPKTNSANGVESTSTGGVIGGICGGLAFMIGVGYYSYHQQRLKQTKEVTADAKIGDAAIAKAIGAGDIETANPVHCNAQAEIEMSVVSQ